MSRTVFFPSDTLIYGISRDCFKNFNKCTCEHMSLGQLRMRARQTKNAPLTLPSFNTKGQSLKSLLALTLMTSSFALTLLSNLPSTRNSTLAYMAVCGGFLLCLLCLVMVSSLTISLAYRYAIFLCSWDVEI